MSGSMMSDGTRVGPFMRASVRPRTGLAVESVRADHSIHGAFKGGCDGQHLYGGKQSSQLFFQFSPVSTNIARFAVPWRAGGD